MDSLLYLQDDVSKRINKAEINYKKSPKDRLNKNYIETRLQSLEQLWAQFIDNHKELLKTCNPKELQTSSYMEKDIYGETEDVYFEFKCNLKAALSKYVEEPEQFSECNTSKRGSGAKLPKIIIPKFSGNYNEWCSFRDLFLSLVHKSDMETIQKMQYLKGLLTGEAEQLVRHINLSSENSRCWEMLETRYNNKRYLCNIILKRLLEQPSANIESASFMKELLDTTSECLGALTNLGVDVSKWDIIIVYITALKLDHESRKQWELQSANSTELSTWKSFEDFLTNRFRALEFVDSGSNCIKPKPQHQLAKSFHVANESIRTLSCKFCKEPHKLAHCQKFVNAKVQTRRGFVEKQNNICFNCLGDNHRANQCLSVSTCRVCQRRHHTYLHLPTQDANEYQTSKGSSIPEVVSEETAAAPVVCFAEGGMAPSSQVLLSTALVRAESNNGDTRIIRALLDQGSQASFITEATAQYLNLKRTSVRRVFSGLGGNTNDVSSNSMVNITIKSIYDPDISLNLNVYVLKSITTLLPSKEVVPTDWILGNISLADPKYNVPNKIDMLLGAAVYSQVVQQGVKKNPEGTLLAQNTTLGWILSGIVSNQQTEVCNIISMHTCVKEVQIKRLWEPETDPKTNNKPTLTKEETRCEQFFTETTARDHDKILPIKTEDLDLKIANSKRLKFDTVSAPYLEVKTHQAAHDEGTNYPAAAENVNTDINTDNLLTGCEETATAMKFYKQMNVQLLQKGMKLQKSSNCKDLLERIRENEEGVDDEDHLKLKADEVMNLLRLTWNRTNDGFQYTVTRLIKHLILVTRKRVIWKKFLNPGRMIRVITYCRRFLTWKKKKKKQGRKSLKNTRTKESYESLQRRVTKDNVLTKKNIGNEQP